MKLSSKKDYFIYETFNRRGFLGDSDGKESACNAEESSSIPESGRFLREGNGTPLQYSCLENPMDGGAWWAPVQGVAKSQARLSDFTFTFTFMHWRRKWQPTPVFLPGEPHGQRSLAGYSPWTHKELDMTEQLTES